MKMLGPKHVSSLSTPWEFVKATRRNLARWIASQPCRSRRCCSESSFPQVETKTRSRLWPQDWLVLTERSNSRSGIRSWPSPAVRRPQRWLGHCSVHSIRMPLPNEPPESRVPNRRKLPRKISRRLSSSLSKKPVRRSTSRLCGRRLRN